MTFNIKCKAKRMTAKQQHRFFQMMQPDIDLRRFAHFTAQSLKFEELEKKEKEPIRREYYHKLNRLKQERARMYMRRYYNRHHGDEMVITKDQAAKLTKVFDTRPTTHIGVISAADIKQQILQPSKPLQQ